MYADRVGIKGYLTMPMWTPDPDAAVISGVDWLQDWKRERDGEFEGLWKAIVGRGNAWLTQGASNMIDRYLASIATPTFRMVASSNTGAVTAATTTIGATARFSGMNATFPSHVAGTAVMSFQSDFTKGSGAGQIDFIVAKMGVSTAATDAVGAIQNIIGGTGGASPYNEPLSVDYTSASSFTWRPQHDITLIPV